jgi:hypothetical protein
MLLQQTDSLAMASPSSAMLSEIFLQYVEFNFVISLSVKHKTLRYFFYVDDMLIIYDHHATDKFCVTLFKSGKT